MIPDWFFTLLRNKLRQNSISQAKRSLPICKQTKALENILSSTYLNKFLNLEISEQSFDFWVLWGEICLSMQKESLQNKQISTCYYNYKYHTALSSIEGLFCLLILQIILEENLSSAVDVMSGWEKSIKEPMFYILWQLFSFI